jgi:hypothetical protein
LSALRPPNNGKLKKGTAYESPVSQQDEIANKSLQNNTKITVIMKGHVHEN